MIYNKDRDNFDKFYELWDPSKEYVLHGASKDAVQLIISLDKILGKNKFY